MQEMVRDQACMRVPVQSHRNDTLRFNWVHDLLGFLLWGQNSGGLWNAGSNWFRHLLLRSEKRQLGGKQLGSSSLEAIGFVICVFVIIAITAA